MTDYNKDKYLKNQVRKQHREEIKSDCKLEIVIEDTLSDRRMQALSFIDTSDIPTLHLKIRQGIMDHVELVKYYLTKIKMSQHNAILEINSKAVEEAKNVKAGILSGIPILIKGNIGTKHLHTSAGAAALRDYTCLDDAEIVKKLKKEGAIILGKTNLSEWANFMSTDSSNGYSALGGQTKNPYGSFDVGGSSSGSAVATSLSLASVTIGTETAGSIIYPASQNGVFGLKPTLGRVSQDKIIPISASYDTAGPMTRNIMDLYLVMKSISDLQTVKFIDNQPKKLGIIINKSVKNYYRPEDQEIIESIKEILLDKNMMVEEVLLEETAFDTKVYEIMKYEFREGIKAFLSERKDYPIQSIHDVVAFNEKDLDKFAPYNHEILKQVSEETFNKIRIDEQIKKNQSLTRVALNRLLDTYDFLLTLSNYCTSVYAPSGHPALCVPISYRRSGEPVGMTIIAKRYQDEALIEFASHLEGFRKNP